MSGSQRPLRIGVIGGGGWLGGAIVDAVVEAGLVRPAGLSLSYRSARPDKHADAFWTTDSQALAARSDVIILSVRPQDWPTLRLDAEGKLVISVMAGISLDAICRAHGTRRAVRAMPNAAAEVRRSFTPWTGTPGVTPDDKALVQSVFEACGIADEVKSEADIDYLTGLSGSGPAFPALLAAAMVEHAVAHGLPRRTAERAARAVIVGAGHLMERSEEVPASTVEAFIDYRGTTAAALEAMRAAGFDRAVAEGLERAFDKARRLGQT